MKSFAFDNSSIQKWILFLYFIVLATVFHFFTIDSKNILLFGYSMVALVILVALNFRSFPRIKHQELIIILLYMVVSTLLNFESSKIISLVYSAFFILSFIFFVSIACECFTLDEYRNLLKTIFIIYFIVLILGQLYVYFDLFTPMPGYATHLPHGRLGTLIEEGKFRYYSLSSEPSYAAFMVVILYYSYIKTDILKGTLFKGQNLYMFLLLVYMILSFQSAYGIILLGLIVINYVGFTKTSILIYLFSAIALAFIFLFKLDIRAIDRVVAIIKNIDITNLHSLATIDFTAYFRVAPVLYYLGTISLTDIHFYIGHGSSASRYLVVPETYLAYQGEFLGGFLPSFFYDYGIIGAGSVLLFIKRIISKTILIPMAIFGLLLFNANFNTQLFWVAVTCFRMNWFFEKRE